MSDLPAALKRLRSLCDAASAGFPLPWTHRLDESWTPAQPIIEAANQWTVLRDENPDQHFKLNRGDDKNRDYIVAACNVVPVLLDALEALIACAPAEHDERCPRAHGYDKLKCRCDKDYMDAIIARLAEGLK